MYLKNKPISLSPLVTRSKWAGVTFLANRTLDLDEALVEVSFFLNGSLKWLLSSDKNDFDFTGGAVRVLPRRVTLGPGFYQFRLQITPPCAVSTTTLLVGTLRVLPDV